MSTNGIAVKDELAEAADQAATPDFDYVMPVSARIKTLFSQAAQHAILRERFLPQVAAAKMQGHNEHKRLSDDAQFHKLCIGRIWLEAKGLGVSEVDFRAGLDVEVARLVPKE